MGWQAGLLNSGSSQTAFGVSAGSRSIGDDITAVGYSVAASNVGDKLTATGYQAGFLNVSDNNTFVGHSAGGNIAPNTGGVQTFDGTDVNTTTDDITITTHGFGANGTYINCAFTQGTAAIGGLTNGTTYQFYIRDANTISTLEGGRSTANITDQLGTGHSLTPEYFYTNATGLGYNAQPTRDNQVKLGDANVTEVMLDGVGAGIVLKSPDGTEYKLTVANGGTLVIT